MINRIAAFIVGLLCLAEVYAADYKHHFLLAGASFGVAENGWFEISCKAFNAEPINKAVSGEAIYHTANRMATNAFYTKEELERTDVFVIMHVHNQNVADESVLKTDYNEYAMPTSNYAVAYDYVIKKYKDDCYKLKDDPTSIYYGTPNGKPAVIVLCTHWHDARTTYNAAIRQLAKKWNLPLVEWDANIGFTKDALENGVQPSIQYAMNNEVINGVTYGWHPLRGQGQYIQQRIAEIFNAKIEQIVGAIPVSASVKAKSNAVLPGESATINVTFTGLPPWNLSFSLNGQITSLANITANPLRLTFLMPTTQVLTIQPLSVSNNSAAGTVDSSAQVVVADKTVNPFYDAYVHQANAATAYTSDAYVQVKTTADSYSREAYFSFNLTDLSPMDEKIVFRAYFYQTVYPSNQSLVENHLVQLAGNTNAYSSLTWNTRPANMTPIVETLVYPADTASYVSWDVTDWVKAQLAEGKTQASFRLKVTNGATGLLYFYSNEASANKPQIIAKRQVATDVTSYSEAGIEIYQRQNLLIIKSRNNLKQLLIHSLNGKCVYKKMAIHESELIVDTASFSRGIYLIDIYDGDKIYKQKICI